MKPKFVMVIGAQCAGKSKFCQRLKGEGFDEIRFVSGESTPEYTGRINKRKR